MTSATPNNLTAAEILKNARQKSKRNRELGTIAKKLCIREDFLEALEAGNYSALPETVYVLGFARNYALELGVDPELITSKIKQEMGFVEEIEDKTKDADTTSDKTVCTVADTRKPIDFKKKFAISVNQKKWLVLGCVAFALFLIVGGAIVMFSGSTNKNDEPGLIEVLSAPSYSKTIATEYGNENKSDAIVIMQATSETWIKIEDTKTREVLFSRVLMPGDIYYAPKGNQNMSMTVGNAGGLDVFVNGKRAPALGSDKVRRSQINMNPETLMIETEQQ